ncbi:MAG: hypothetical protein ACRETB_04685 [Steroidobacteraceae bacterium]
MININDDCVIVFMPFPIGDCGIGHIPVKGDMFKHMGDYNDRGISPFENPRFLDGHRAKPRRD